MHVGLPCMKLSLSPSTQKHNGRKAGTCSVKAAWDEMRDVRRGRDETIDRSMTDQNVWLRGSTDMDMEAEVQKYIDLVNADKKAHGKRALRCDAVTGIEMIEKPPMEYMEKMSREEQIWFLRVSSDVLDQILRDWNPDWITVAQVIHFDEFGGKAPHTHRIVVPLTKDKNGVLAFNAKSEFNLKFFTFVNTEYPKRMRERGYEVEDCKIYDRMTEEEKEEHRRNKPEYGLEGFEYKRRKQQELETAIVEKEAVVEDLEDRQRELADQNKTLEERNRKIKVRIMTEEEVKALPKPQKTLGGDYKISPKKYQNLLATAKRVDIADYNQRVMRDKEQRLREKETELEKKRRLPIPERMELSALRKMKAIIEKVAMMLPEGWLRDVLVAAIDGRDLIAEQQRQRTRSRGNYREEI